MKNDTIEKDFVKNNNRFKILNDSGFSDFIGVIKKPYDQKILEITIDDCIIKVTHEHEIYIDKDNYVKASDLNVNDLVLSDDGLIKITSIKEIETDYVYDVLHVYDENRFYISFGKRKLLINNCIYCDELGFVANAEEFYESVYPTITSSDTTKVIITSTPKGLNYFYKMWVDAEKGRSEYIAYDVKWFEHPERDQKWYDTQVKNMNAKSIEQEIHCVAGNTEITFNGKKIKMKELYDRYSVKNSINNNIVYFNE